MRETSGRDIIDEEVIQDCVRYGAEDKCLAWLRTKPRTLRQLHHDHKKWFTQLSVSTTIPTVLEVLSTDKDANVRRNVAVNTYTPKPVLKNMATGSDWEVLKSIGSNPNSPATLLKKMAASKESQIRIAVALNENVPLSVLIMLSRDKDWFVRMA